MVIPKRSHEIRVIISLILINIKPRNEVCSAVVSMAISLSGQAVWRANAHDSNMSYCKFEAEHPLCVSSGNEIM